MALSITGGALRGRRFAAPKGRGVRPTAAKVREALFSILGQRLDGYAVLDLCAGTGALGLEAGSRGAHRVVFVERSREHLRQLRSNAELLGDATDVSIQGGDARRAPGRLADGGERFDLVFLDPPYRTGVAAEVLEAIGSHAAALLHEDARVVVETAFDEELPLSVGDLHCKDPRRYGETRIWIFEGS